MKRIFSVLLVVFALTVPILKVVKELHAQTTVPIGTTQVLQPGVSMGMHVWAAPDATLQGQAVTDCAMSGNIAACVSAQAAVTADMQQRAAMFMQVIHNGSPAAVDGVLKTYGLWYLP